MGLWTFDGDKPLHDASSDGHNLTLQGAELQPKASSAGPCSPNQGGPSPIPPIAPDVPMRPGYRRPTPSPSKCGSAPAAELDADYPESSCSTRSTSPTPTTNSILRAASKAGSRTLRACLGFGTHSANWYSDPLKLKTGRVASHLAFTYDAQGTGSFFLTASPGAPAESRLRPGRSRHATADDRRPQRQLLPRLPGAPRPGPDLPRRARISSAGRSSGSPIAPASCAWNDEASQQFRVTNLCRETLPGAKVTIQLDGAKPGETKRSRPWNQGRPSIGLPTRHATSAGRLLPRAATPRRQARAD